MRFIIAYWTRQFWTSSPTSHAVRLGLFAAVSEANERPRLVGAGAGADLTAPLQLREGHDELVVADVPRNGPELQRRRPRAVDVARRTRRSGALLFSPS
jgi:hypothetical protein